MSRAPYPKRCVDSGHNRWRELCDSYWGVTHRQLAHLLQVLSHTVFPLGSLNLENPQEMQLCVGSRA
jgi:hypothetical protein